MLKIADAISRLRFSGLCVAEPRGDIGGIIGGSEFKCVGDIGVYKDAFSIAFENGSWIVRVPGEGQMIEEVAFSELESAVWFVLAVYQRMGVL
jgi:hypothetical protein